MQCNIQASNQLVAEVGKLTDWMESGRDKRKWKEEGVRNLQGQVRILLSCPLIFTLSSSR